MLALLALAVTSSQSHKVPVGIINFFGTEGMDVETCWVESRELMKHEFMN